MYICVIQFNVKRLYTPSRTLSLVEYEIDQFAMQMYGAVYKSSRTILKSENLPAIRLYKRYEIFFHEEIRAMYCRKPYDTESQPPVQPLVVSTIMHSKVLFDEFLQTKITITGTKVHQSTFPSRIPIGRCFFSARQSSECGKCIAIHTTSFGIRIYALKSSVQGKHTLFAFSTVYSQETIHEHCSRTYCLGLHWISTAACEKLDQIFLIDKRILQEVGAAATRMYRKVYTTTNCINQAHSNTCGIISSTQDIGFRSMMSRLNDTFKSKQDFSTVKPPIRKFREIAILEEFLEPSMRSYQLDSHYDFVF